MLTRTKLENARVHVWQPRTQRPAQESRSDGAPRREWGESSAYAHWHRTTGSPSAAPQEPCDFVRTWLKVEHAYSFESRRASVGGEESREGRGNGTRQLAGEPTCCEHCPDLHPDARSRRSTGSASCRACKLAGNLAAAFASRAGPATTRITVGDPRGSGLGARNASQVRRADQRASLIRLLPEGCLTPRLPDCKQQYQQPVLVCHTDTGERSTENGRADTQTLASLGLRCVLKPSRQQLAAGRTANSDVQKREGATDW
ncbi:hypothetical protein OH76DRAFT_1490963 [Lentinus brumalis]|uniref:Uncharacterized protein n=1 Tax=Lentinus brumalis TaxID=2498619 RepID=A0A371CH67_9APHY|nr:hypothetical protein OH76DRAFT_1490963 [Polyporus brumalis]